METIDDKIKEIQAQGMVVNLLEDKLEQKRSHQRQIADEETFIFNELSRAQFALNALQREFQRELLTAIKE